MQRACRGLTAVFALLFASPCQAAAAPAASVSLQIRLTAAPSAQACSGAASEAWARSASLDELLFDQAEIDRYFEATHTFVLTPAATARLFTNSAAFAREDDGAVPTGSFFAAAGHGFVIVLDGKRLAAGIVATLEDFSDPPACALIYPVPPMLDRGRLMLSIGRLRSRAELGEEPFKVMMEEGVEAAFQPVVPVQVVEHLRRLGKVDRGR